MKKKAPLGQLRSRRPVRTRFKLFQLKSWLISLTILMAGASCSSSDQQSDPQTQSPASQEAKQIERPDFNADSAYYFVKNQVEFGPRVPNTKAHAQCARWLERKLTKYTDQVKVQEATVKAYNNTSLNIKNIIAKINPKAEQRIMLCAHWDTRHIADRARTRQDEPIPGANDGASGAGVLLEIARQLKTKDLNIGVDIVLFDAEDYGPPAQSQKRYPTEKSWCLGAQYWAKKAKNSTYKPHYGILLDMVGDKNATFTMEGNSRKFARSQMRKIWDTGVQLGYSEYFKYETTKPIMDDHFYVNRIANIPCLNIVHYDFSTPTNFPPYWHTHEDDMDNISRETLKAVGQTVLGVLQKEDRQRPA